MNTPIIIEAELDGRECNLMVIDGDFLPKVGDIVWVRHVPDGNCFDIVVDKIEGEIFKVEEL